MRIPAKISLLWMQCQTYKAESEFQCWQKGPIKSVTNATSKQFLQLLMKANTVPVEISYQKGCFPAKETAIAQYATSNECYLPTQANVPSVTLTKGRLSTHIECNSCVRSILTNGEGKMTIAGFCGNGHILCQHCVIIAEDRLTCPICFLEVQGQGIAEIREVQQTCLCLASV